MIMTERYTVDPANYYDEQIKFYRDQIKSQQQQQCQLRCLAETAKLQFNNFIDNWTSAMRIKQRISSQKQIAASIILPHVIISSASQSSLFLQFFHNASPGSISFSNVTITEINKSSPAQSFSSNIELSDYLNNCAVSSQTLKVSGTLCGDVALFASLSHLYDIHFTFECSISPFLSPPSSSPSASSSSLISLDYLMNLTRIARSVNAGDLLSSEMKSGDSLRPESVEAMWRANQEKKSELEQPELRWRKRRNLAETQWSELSSEQRDDAELEYQQQLARCDQHDLEIKQRWLERVNANSPGIRPVIMTVDDDDSVVVNARLRVTGDGIDGGIPLRGKLSMKEDAYCKLLAISFTSSDVQDELDARQHDMNQVSRYHRLGDHCRRGSPEDEYRSYYVRKFGGIVGVSGKDLKVDWEFDSWIADVKIILPMKSEDSIELFEDCQLWNLVFKSTVGMANGGVRSVKPRIKFNLRLIWQESEAPPALWALRGKAKSDKSVEADKPDVSSRVEAFTINFPPFSTKPIVFYRRYTGAAESLFSEEVCVDFPIEAAEPEHSSINISFMVHPSIASFVFDKLYNHNEIIVKQRKEAKELGNPETIIPSPSSLLSLANKHFPDIALVLESDAKIVSCLNFDKLDNLANKNETRGTKITAPVIVKQLIAELSYPDRYRSINIQFKKEKTPFLTLTQFLTACNLQHLLKHFPSSLIENIRLTDCNISAELIKGESKFYARASTGKRASACLLIMANMDVKNNYDEKTKQSEYVRNVTIIKLHDTKFITNKYFPALIDSDSMNAKHSFVYYDGDRELSSNNSLNDLKGRCCEKYSKSCEFPKTIIPTGSNFLTIKQQKISIWTPALNNTTRNVVVVNELIEQNEQPNDTNQKNRAVSNRYDIPTALLRDLRCPYHLAHYLLDFLPINAILFTVRHLSRAHQTSSLLQDNQWWKQRLTRVYGVSVTRWSDATLQQWRTEWLMRTPQNIRDKDEIDSEGNVIKKNPMDENIRATVEAQPIWFSAVTHLQTRLNRFECDIMKQSKPEFLSNTRISSAFHYVLLVAPPFQLCDKCLDHGNPPCEFLVNNAQQRQQMMPQFRAAFYHEHLCWFSHRHHAEHSRCFTLYTGPCYVKADHNTAAMGEKVENSNNEANKKDDDADQDDNEVEEEENDENDCDDDDDDATMKSDGDDESSSDKTIGDNNNPKEIREVKFTDPNLFPVFEWEPYQDQFWLEARSAHEFFVSAKIYQKCQQLAGEWDERESKLLTTGNLSKSQALKDNSDLKDETNNKDFSHLSPPFEVHFDRSMMNKLIESLQTEIAADCNDNEDSEDEETVDNDDDDGDIGE